MNDFTSCPFILNCTGRSVKTERVLKSKETYAYLFASSTCSGQKDLLLKLKDVYREVKKRKIPLEIFYISSDRDPDEMLKHFKANHHDAIQHYL
ncbi:Thioredoxin-like [Popillia japonica]|uniref:Thioredoxin-like n=1 Tax=Popillia japonica TaxID=7064 RepID=A0AAW1IYW9_POPJA